MPSDVEVESAIAWGVKHTPLAAFGVLGLLLGAGRGAHARDIRSLPLVDEDPTLPDSATRALFWLNRILLQIAATFESLVADRDGTVVACATRAYERTMATYNTPPQRAFAKMLLRVVPDRAGLVACYGFERFDDLEPVCQHWLKAARPVCESISCFFDKHPELKTPRPR